MTHDSGERPLLLLIACSYSVYRAYILESVSARYRLWLLNPAPPASEGSWRAPSETVLDDRITASSALATQVPTAWNSALSPSAAPSRSTATC